MRRSCSTRSLKPGGPRPLGRITYLILYAEYQKVRQGGVVRDAAVLSAIGVGPDERRRVLGVSVALSEAEVHWRVFLESLQARGMRGVEYVVSDDHAGLRAARRAVLGGATWQRCQFHLARNAVHHAPNLADPQPHRRRAARRMERRLPGQGRNRPGQLVADYRDTAPALAAWLEEAVPEGLAVFSLPDRHRRRLRTSNPMERAVQQELKRRTAKVRVFPNEDLLERLVSAVPVEIDDKWAAHRQGPYQMGMPGCVIIASLKFQTSGCSIRKSAPESRRCYPQGLTIFLCRRGIRVKVSYFHFKSQDHFGCASSRAPSC